MKHNLKLNRPKFKFCSIPPLYFLKQFLDTEVKEIEEINIPSTHLIPLSAYRNGAYWIRDIPTKNIKAFGVVYIEGKWYEWEGLSSYSERWVEPKHLSNKEIEMLSYFKRYNPEYLSLEIKNRLDYWNALIELRNVRNPILIWKRRVLKKKELRKLNT